MISKIQNHHMEKSHILLECTGGTVQITALAEDCFRVRAKPDAGRFDPPLSYAVAKSDWNTPPIHVADDAGSIGITAGATTCIIDKADSRIRFQTGGRTYCVGAGMVWEDGALHVHKRLAPDEAIYGLGQRAFGLNLRGRCYKLWNSDPITYDRGDDPTYYSIPFYVAADPEGRAYGLFFDNAYRGEIDVGAADPDRLTFRFEGGELRYYVFTGPTIAGVLARYTELTGRLAMPPLWALGYHQSRWGYYPEARVREIAAEFRKRRIPCDVIHLDIDYMDGYRCFTWHPERFPDPAGLARDLRADGFRLITIIDAGIKVDEEYAVDQTGLAKDVYVKTPEGEPFVGPVWPGPCHFPDFTNPNARDWWADQCEAFASVGIEGIWNDMNEPAVFGAEAPPALTLPDDLLHNQDIPHVAVHNLYGTLMARASREGMERLRPGKRQVILTRAAFAGAQRETGAWTGDNKSTWDHIRLSISMCLNLGLSGMAFTGPDVGGFANAGGFQSGEGTPTAEMVTRWIQVGACLPFFRMHSAAGTPDQEPWSYGPEHEAINRRYIELRYALLPHIYTAAAECARGGVPIVRPMVMEDPNYPDMDDQFFLGDHLLAAPVMDEGARSRRVTLPPGIWYDFWTGAPLQGGQTVTVEAPLDVLPLFVRAGAVIPMWPPAQHTGAYPAQTLRLRIFAGSAQTSLYEDSGDGPMIDAGWSTIDVQQDGTALEVAWARRPNAIPTHRHVDITVTGFAGSTAWIDGERVQIAPVQDGVTQIAGAPSFETLRIEA